MATVLKPLGKRLIVKRDEAEGKTPGGILLPEGAKQKPKTGVVLAVGSEVGYNKTREMIDPLMAASATVPKPGDRVVFVTYAGVDMEHEGENLLILLEEDVMAVIVPVEEKPEKRKK